MIQEEDYKEVEKKILAHKEKGVSQELEKKKVAEQKRQRKLTEENERQKKKEALPDELTEDNINAINIVYRLPDGNRVSRRFNRHFPVSVPMILVN